MRAPALSRGLLQRVISRRSKPDKRCRFPAPELDASKVAAALAHSTVVAAAYVTDSGGGGGASAGAAPSNNAAPREPALGGWLSLLPRAPQRRLVGFARAAGDATLVALVADVAVAPQHRKTGVGARLVAAVLDELRALGVADVGALSSDALRPFFRSVSRSVGFSHVTHHQLTSLALLLRSKCRFGPDSEGAVHMALPAPLRAAWAAGGAATPLQQPALHSRLHGELRAAAARAAAAADAAAAAAARGGPRAMAPPPRPPIIVRAPQHTRIKRTP